MHRILALTLAVGWLGGCPSMGEYAVYHVAFQPETYSMDCYPDGVMPEDIAQDTTTLLASDTLVVFKGVEGVVYAELGQLTLEGTKDEGVLSFYAETVDVEPAAGEETEATVTRLDTIDIELEPSGSQVTGEVETYAQVTCAGADCPAGFGSSCTVTAQFTGTRVDEVELTHEL